MLYQWRAPRGARAPGWGEPKPGFLCVSARATLSVQSQITAGASASLAFPYRHGPCPGSASARRRLPASLRLPLVSAGLSFSLRPLLPCLPSSELTDQAKTRDLDSVSRQGFSPGLGWRLRGLGTVVRGWPLAIWGKTLMSCAKSVSPSPYAPLPFLLQAIRNISCLAGKKGKERCPQNATSRSGDPEAK